MHERPHSLHIFQGAERVLPGGVNSPVRAFPGLSLTPLIVERGEGAIITDVDGHDYIDYCCSWGALMLGHSHPGVTKAILEQLEKGTSFGITTPIEADFARLIARIYPSMQKLRFVSSGTEATMTAIRLARGFTGKSTIIKFEGNYHGHSDGLLVKAGSGVAHLPESSSKGVPPELVQHTLCLPFNDTEAVRKTLRSRRDVAAVIVEPIAGNMGVVPAYSTFLKTLREETALSGALLILDEVITGFRVGLRGAQELYGITPDLTCLGKIIGGGFPAAAFGGKAAIMDQLAPLGNVYQAGTLSGFPVAMAAGKATIEYLVQPGFYEELEEKTGRFTTAIKAFILQHELPVCLQRSGSMLTIFFGVRQVKTGADLRSLDKEAFQAFFAFMLERGIYIPPAQQEAWFISSAHTEEHLALTAQAIFDFFISFYALSVCYEERQILLRN